MNPILNTALKAARQTGQMMIRASGDLKAVKIDNKAFDDFVSNVDRESEMILVNALKEAYPHHRVTCEESGSHGKSDAEYEWIIDPLDGTTNFLHGHPQYAISMTLPHKGVLQEALIYTPERNDLYMAPRGQGALLNNRHIRVSNHVGLNRYLIGTGLPVIDQGMTDKYLAILKDSLSRATGGRRESSAALDLCSVAVGRLDNFFEFSLKPQDVAADTLIMKEAGGIVADMQGGGTWLQTGNIVADNSKVLAQMLQITSAHS